MSPASSFPTRPFAVPDGRRFSGELLVPPSKSLTNRYLNLALLSRGRVVLERPLLADDTRRFVAALKALGRGVELAGEVLELRPGTPPSEAVLDCGESGSMARFLTAALCALPGDWRLVGGSRLERRPLGPLVAALRRLGARIDHLDREGFLPIAIRGGSLEGGETELEAGESSQYLSALLMAACAAAGEVRVRVGSLTSRPYLDLTLAALERFGVEAEASGDLYRVAPGPPAGGRFRVEGDFSSACYPAAAACLSGGRVVLSGLAADSRQGDRRFLDLLAAMGAEVDWKDSERVGVAAAGALRALEADLSDMPDQAPTLAALGPFAGGTTRISGVPHLRIKESDRLAACAAELRRAGAEVEELADGLVVPGVWSEAKPPARPVDLDSHGDHRIAMSFALVGLRRPGIRILHPEVVAKSYPRFWTDFSACLVA